MPPTRAALVVVMSGAPDHGEITLKPMPAPNASRSSVKAAATKPPAMMAGHDTAETAGVSASTMTAPSMSRGNEQLRSRFRAGEEGLSIAQPGEPPSVPCENTGETREAPD